MNGLSHSDYSRKRPEHIKNDYIEMIMFKGKEKVFIPLGPALIEVLKKWDYSIPKMTSEELGRYIKEIGKMSCIVSNGEITESKGNHTIINQKTKKPKTR